jgi:CHAD domain-containing protein
MEEFAKETIIKLVAKIAQYKAAVLCDTDPEPLHKMRVGMRRLRSILQILEPVVILPRACNQQFENFIHFFSQPQVTSVRVK